MGLIDVLVFVAFIAAVLFVGIWKSRTKHEHQDAQDFFLAGRGLTWWLIGFSLIAANISTEQFVGMSGNAASHVGLAIASYEWLAAVTLFVVAFGFLPYFLRAGIYTMPEFLEYRYNSAARFLMAAATVLIYLLLLGAVTYSGALTVATLGKRFGMDIALWQPSLFIALIAMIYVVCGGLKASVWADLLQGSALIIGGAIIMWIAFSKLGTVEDAATVVDVSTGEVAVQSLDASRGPFERFMDLNANQLNMFLPASDHVLPWTALLLGMWIPNFYYWGLNQYITQRTLGSSSLASGQNGIIFAAYLKLLIPFVVVIPGIIAFNLFHKDMQLEASSDASVAMALYLKSNPETEFVATEESLDGAAIEAHQGPGYVIALYESLDDIRGLKSANPFVLPMTKSAFDKIKPAEFQLSYATENWQKIRTVREFNNLPIDVAEGVRWYLDPTRANERDPQTGRSYHAEGKTAGILELSKAVERGLVDYAARVYLKGEEKPVNSWGVSALSRKEGNATIRISEAFESADEIDRVEFIRQKRKVETIENVILRLDLLSKESGLKVRPKRNAAYEDAVFDRPPPAVSK